MIKIEVIGKGQLDLQGTTALSFEFISPLFKKEVAQTGYSYPIDIPLTDNNIKLLGFLDRLDIDNDFESLPCRISHNDIALVDGTLNISSISPDGKRASCFVLGYEFDVALLDTPLRKVPMGGVRTIVPTLYAEMYEHANALLDANSDTSDYCFFPVKNERFYEGNANINGDITYLPGHKYSKVVNLWDPQLQSFWQPVTITQLIYDYPVGGPYGVYAEDPKASTFVPFPFVVSVLKFIAAFLGGYKLTGEWVNDNTIKLLSIYNTQSLDKLESTFNYFRTNADINIANHVPDITVSEFLSAIADMFNLSLNIDTKLREVRIDRKVVFLPSSEEIIYGNEKNFTVSSGDANNGITFSLQTDDSDIQQDIFKEFVIDDRVLTDADSFLPLDALGAVRFGATSYKASVNGAGAFIEMPSAPVFRLGNGTQERKIACGTVDTAKNISIEYSFYDGLSASAPTTYLSGIIPIAQQIGNSDIYNVHDSYTLRLLFYAGTHTDPNGYGIYPIGTSNIYADNGDTILPYSLKWRGGEHALYDAWHKDWEKMLFAKKVQCNLLLSVTDFLNLDLTKKIRLENRLYFIERLQVPISHAGIGVVKATLVQIPL